MMSYFSSSSPFDAEVEKATDNKNTSEDWALIMEICDRVGHSSQHAKDCLRSIVKRLSAADPHIVIPAITLLDACSSNCGKIFHLEIASRHFEQDLRKLITLHRNQPKVYEKLKGLIKKWAEGDFKTDPQLNLIPSLYNKLKSEGHDFSSISETPGHSAVTKNPYNEITSATEEAELAKAIELSLKETKRQASTSSPATKKSTSLYPSVNSASTSSSNTEGRKVLALYDFEADEDNELTFLAGEIIQILDDSDPNWWKGSNHRGEGLFPSNFVTADLSVEPEQYTKLEHNTTKKSVQFSEEVEIKTEKREPEIIEVEIDEQKMDRLLSLFNEVNPQSDSSDTQEMLDLEEQVTAMGPLIDTALEKVDRQHAQLTQLSSDLVDALNLYHSLMRETNISNYTLSKMQPSHMNYTYPAQGPSPLHMYNGLPAGSQAPFNPRGVPPPRFNPSMPPNNEFMGPANMPRLPQHYPMQHGQQQPMPGPGQGTPDQNNVSYPPNQGYLARGGPVGPYAPAGHPGTPMNQQQQYPPNGQHM